MINFTLWWISLGLITVGYVRYKEGPMKITDWIIWTILWPFVAWAIMSNKKL